MKKIIIFILISSKISAQIPSERYVRYISTNYRHLMNACIVIPLVDKRKQYYAVTENYSLHDYYFNKSGLQGKMNYQTFMTSLFQKKIRFDIRKAAKYDYNKIDNRLAIFKDYKSVGISFILSKYLEPVAGDFRNKNNLDQQTIYGLIQIMFENGYLIGFSDYSGYYQFTKHFRKS